MVSESRESTPISANGSESVISASSNPISVARVRRIKVKTSGSSASISVGSDEASDRESSELRSDSGVVEAVESEVSFGTSSFPFAFRKLIKSFTVGQSTNKDCSTSKSNSSRNLPVRFSDSRESSPISSKAIPGVSSDASRPVSSATSFIALEVMLLLGDLTTG